MSKITDLARSQINAVPAIKIKLVELIEHPAVVPPRGPPNPPSVPPQLPP